MFYFNCNLFTLSGGLLCIYLSLQTMKFAEC